MKSPIHTLTCSAPDCSVVFTRIESRLKGVEKPCCSRNCANKIKHTFERSGRKIVYDAAKAQWIIDNFKTFGEVGMAVQLGVNTDTMWTRFGKLRALGFDMPHKNGGREPKAIRVPKPRRERKPKPIKPKPPASGYKESKKIHRLPDRIVDESKYKTVRINSKMEARVLKTVSDQEIIDKYNKRKAS